MLVWMCSAHVNQRSSKNCIIPLGVGAARGDYSGLGFLTQTGSIIRDTEVSKTVVLTLQFPWKKTPSQMQLEDYANTTTAE